MQAFEFNKVWAVAQAERRLTRRLKRYWFFLVPAFAVALAYFLYLSAIHGFGSSFSASLGMVNPRYLVGVAGFFFLALFLAGIVFLSFDVRARDQRERIAETVDSRPLSNLEILAGRFLGLFLSAWIPLLVLCLLLQLLGWLLVLLGSPVGASPEPWSVVGFAVFVAVPALAFVISVVFLLTLLVRNRLLAALLSIAVFAGLFAATMIGPPWSVPLVDFAGTSLQRLASDLLPGISTASGWLQRAGVLLAAFALVGLAAAVHPRLDAGSRPRKAAAAGGVLALALVTLLGASVWRGDTVSRIETWRAAHEARADEAVPDLLALNGSVAIEPGRNLGAELSLRFRAPPSAPLENALFSLNPGLAVESATGPGGQALDIRHADGLLDIALPTRLAPGESTTVELRFSGKPDIRFGYLDSPLLPEDLPGQGDQILMGTDRAIFDSRFVALMPGIYWLPLSGVDPDRNDLRERPRDYFDLALDVELPGPWLAAGPGKRQALDAADAGRAAFRFAPGAPVPEAALVAAEFTPYRSRIGGIDFEILLHPGHTRSMEVLAPIREDVEQWVEQRLAVLQEAGLSYPFAAFTLVEVPNSLLGYQGGWRTDTAFAPPAMALLSESGFPTARFDFNMNVGPTGNISLNFGPDNFTHVDRHRLLDFFTNDITGSNIFVGAARSFFAHQSSAAGDEAIVLDYVLDNLATLAVSGARPYFSPYSFNEAVADVVSGVTSRRGEDSILEATINQALANVSLWNQAMDTSLIRMDPWEDPARSIDLFALKGGELAKSMYHALGDSGTARLLAALLEQHRGGAYRVEDVQAQLRRHDPGLAVMFEEMLYSSRLPGFVAERAELYRLPDSDGGTPRYQLLLAIRNDEPVPGYIRPAWVMPGEEGQLTRGDAIRIEGRGAVEFGVVLSQPPARAIIDPYLSLNWSLFPARIFDVEAIPRRDAEPLEGTRPIPWDDSSERIVTDDLDPGFTVLVEASDGSFEPAPPPPDDDPNIDHGLQVSFGQPADWSRNLTPSSWGRYRHTYAVARAGSGDKKAVMPADLPHAGLWDLEIHLPEDQRTRGRMKLEIVSADGREPVEYDARSGAPGWNLVGQYRLPAGEVNIEVSNDTDAVLAVADAFAWTPLNSGN